MLKRLTGGIAAALLLCVASAQAADYRVDFQVSGFKYFMPDDQLAAPFASAYGSAVFSADALDAHWTALKDFNLVIGDQHYTLADIAYESGAFGATMGGTLYGAGAVFSNSNDFSMGIYPGAHVSVTYATLGTYGIWYNTSSSQHYTELTAAPVPELETYAMLAAGLGLLGAVARRRKA
ncbi:MAG: PEP-CTERM sorting domain-containing protein [Duganella sp.]